MEKRANVIEDIEHDTRVSVYCRYQIIGSLKEYKEER